jgi:hypothetical protein
MPTKYAYKWILNSADVHKIYQMAIKDMKKIILRPYVQTMPKLEGLVQK